MKKWLLVFVIVGLLFWIWVALRLTHTLEYYSLPGVSDAPTLPKGSIVFASRLKTPDFNNFICFKKPTQSSPHIYRCIGKPADIIEIKSGKVYRNGKLLDEPFTNNNYIITRNQLNRVNGYIEANKNELTPLSDTTYRVTLSGNELKAYHLSLIPDVSPKAATNEYMFDDFKKAGYNEDYLGPVKVPAGCYFLLGDNRHNALDSRYIGFIKKDEIIATVLNH